MIINSWRVLDQLAAEEPCLGALFTSFSFDPAFFEDHVLRAVLRLTSDPTEQAERYHSEARRALQEAPVVAIVDAAERRPGRRLPYDLLEVSSTVFHPKSVLLLYRGFARLLIGSGNLTFPGYGGNTELFLKTDLSYADSAQASLLAAFNSHLRRIRTLVRQPGTQLDLFQRELERRIPNAIADSVSPQIAFLDSTAGPIAQQLAALLPPNAVVESVGMLAPFYERDDDGEIDARSVFGVFAQQLTKNARLDIGVAWENPQIHDAGDDDIDRGLGRLWTWAAENDGVRTLRHLIPTSVGPSTVAYTDDTGQGRRCPLDDVRKSIERRRLWMQPMPIAFAPRDTIASASKLFSDVRLWLHPATRLEEGRPIHRPLHAKLMVISYRSGRARESLVMLGSPNMSRRALLMQAGPGAGNVEAAMAFRLDSSVSLRDLVPELVHVPVSAFGLKEREFPVLERNFGLAIDQAIHDPVAGTLVVTWSEDAADLPAWEISYCGSRLTNSTSPPDAPFIFQEFALRPSTAELVLRVDGREFAVPILVTDLIALPASPAGPTVGLQELLMLLGRRIGTERALQITECRSGQNASDELLTIFGDGFGPTDVFRAWWSVAEDLKVASLTVQGFRLRLDGALGAGAAWAGMLAAVGQQALTPEEVWFYGAELLRSLNDVAIPVTDDGKAKGVIMKAFRRRVQEDLDALGIEAGSPSWMKKIHDFYSEAQA
ncbi:hypothetical protein P5Y53_19230 [Dyella jiangningensis]|uniref:hypothetical protein n=1 Tax=Dyella jiangningensis TaxID=1379159 RepID=UPI00240FFC6B|nr:hypothetical protein [Dyella jiangningensis]MDG2539820.1 hypothetical protein [Dyella jiangningensis]